MAKQPAKERFTPPTGDALQSLLTRAEQGDDSVLAELRQLLDHVPQIWRQVGNLSRRAEAAWIELIAGKNLLAVESLRRTLADLKAGLEGASPLEKILVERIALCWLTATYADISYAEGKDLSLRQGRFLVQRQVAMNHRLITSIKALATVRSLLSRVELNRAKAESENQRSKPPLKVHRRVGAA